VGLALAGAAFAGLGVQLSAASSLENNCGVERLCPPEFDAEGTYRREQIGHGLFLGFGIASIAGLGAGITGIVLALNEEPNRSAPALHIAPVVSSEHAGAQLRVRF